MAEIGLIDSRDNIFEDLAWHARQIDRNEFFPKTTSENISEVNVPEEMVWKMTIWDAQRLTTFASKYARKENGNIVCNCINNSHYVSQINTYEIN